MAVTVKNKSPEKMFPGGFSYLFFLMSSSSLMMYTDKPICAMSMRVLIVSMWSLLSAGYSRPARLYFIYLIGLYAKCFVPELFSFIHCSKRVNV